MKNIFLMVCFYSGVMSLSQALEITSVTRDFEYRNIFTYKHDLIGDAQANKFGFEGHDNIKPEYFVVKIKSFPSEEGESVTVVFQYKTRLSRELKEIRQKLTLNRSREKVYFRFSSAQNEREGCVEIWRACVYKENKLLSEYQSSAFQWR
ncbi:MAG: hypothetical protein JW774_11065 [Candidatus Aureabacteria bacterium]|nr:hypothetical protein [Candidatus Auribacterota bacterium]